MNQLLYSKVGSLIKVEPTLATSIGQIQLDRPVMLASGILGISLDVFNRLYRSGAGAVVEEETIEVQKIKRERSLEEGSQSYFWIK